MKIGINIKAKLLSFLSNSKQPPKCKNMYNKAFICTIKQIQAVKYTPVAFRFDEETDSVGEEARLSRSAGTPVLLLVPPRSNGVKKCVKYAKCSVLAAGWSVVSVSVLVLVF